MISPLKRHWIVFAALTCLCAAGGKASTLFGQSVIFGEPAPIDRVVIQSDSDQWFAVATSYYERGEWNEAADKFQTFIERFPEDPRIATARFFCGEALLQLDRGADARAAFQHYLKIRTSPEMTEKAMFRIAEVSARGDERDAVRHLENFLQLYPRSEFREFALYYLGHQRLDRNEPQLARQVIEVALREFPSSKMRLENLLGAGLACRAMGDLPPARGYFMQLANESTGEMQTGANLQLAAIHTMQQEHDAAIKLLDDLLKKPELSEAMAGEAWMLLGNCLAAQGKEARAIDCFERTLELADDPQILAAATWQLSLAHARNEDFFAARACLKSLLENWPENRLARVAAESLVRSTFEAGDYGQVISLVDSLSVIPLLPEQLTATQELKGRAQYALERYTESENTFESLLTSSPAAEEASRSVWLYFAGSSQIGMGDFEAALQTLKLIPVITLPAQQIPRCKMATASALLGLNRPGEAIPLLTDVVNSGFTDDAMRTEARHQLMVALIQQKEWSRSEELLDGWWKIEKGSRRSVAAILRLAADAESGGKTGIASKCYQLLYSSEHVTATDKIRAVSSLGWLAFDQGNNEEALGYFEALTQENPDCDEATAAWLAMATIHERRQSWETASWMYGHAARKSASENQRQLAMFKQAVCLRKLGTPNSISRGGSILEQLANRENPSVPPDQLQFELAWFEEYRGDSDAAEKRFALLVDEHQDSELWADSALRVVTRKLAVDVNDKSADELLEQILVRDRVSPGILARALFLKGQRFGRQNDWVGVESIMKQAIEIPAADETLKWRCRYWVAEALFRQEKFRESLTEFQLLAQNEVRFDQAIVPWIWLRSGQCYASMEDWPGVARTLENARGRFTDFSADWEFEFLAGRLKFSQGLFDDAIRLFTNVTRASAARGSETAAQAQWLIGESCFHQEKYREAIEAYYLVDSQYQSPTWRGAALLQAGKCQEQLGNPQHALRLYRELQEKYPASRYAEAAKPRMETVARTVATQKNARRKTATRASTGPQQR